MKLIGKRTIQKGIVIALALLPVVALAATLPNPTPPISGTGVSVSELLGLINQVARWLIGISLVIVTIMIVYNALKMTIFSKGDDESVKEAKTSIKHAIIAALIIIGVGVILQTLVGIVNRSALQ